LKGSELSGTLRFKRLLPMKILKENEKPPVNSEVVQISLISKVTGSVCCQDRPQQTRRRVGDQPFDFKEVSHLFENR